MLALLNIVKRYQSQSPTNITFPALCPGRVRLPIFAAQTQQQILNRLVSLVKITEIITGGLGIQQSRAGQLNLPTIVKGKSFQYCCRKENGQTSQESTLFGSLQNHVAANNLLSRVRVRFLCQRYTGCHMQLYNVEATTADATAACTLSPNIGTLVQWQTASYVKPKERSFVVVIT